MKQGQDVAQRRWRGIMAAQRESGLGVAGYCRREGIAEASFYAWKRRLRDAPAFVEIKGAAERASGAGGMEVILVGGRRLAVRAGFDRDLLVELIGTLEGLA